MPTRLIDLEAMARSDKLARCSLSAEAWYPWLLTLALGNGSFEADAEAIKIAVFSKGERQVMSADQIEGLLLEYERERLLVLWTAADGKRWGYWTAIERRLPKCSALKKGEHRLGEWVPARKLAKALRKPMGLVLTELAERFAEVKGEPYLSELRRSRQDRAKTAVVPRKGLGEDKG